MRSTGGRRIAGIGAALLLAAVSSCTSADEGSVVLSADEHAKVATLSPLPRPKADPTNRVADDPGAAALGQKLFFETRFSGPIRPQGAGDGIGAVGNAGETGKVACATCHQPGAQFQDVRSIPNSCSIGTGWTARNTPPVVNAAFYDWFFWDGHADSMWSQALDPVEGTVEMNTSRLRVAHVLYASYRDEYNRVFDPDLDPDLDPASANAKRFPDSTLPPSDPASPWATMSPADQAIVNGIYANFGKAIAAYERLLVSGNAPFDRYVAGDEAAINTQAKLGLKLFVGKAACVACHEGPFFSDNKFHNTGVPQSQGDVLHVAAHDTGRFDAIATVQSDTFNTSGPFSDSPTTGKLAGLAAQEGDRGAFRTKGLREVAETAPYAHGGQLRTLEETVELYDRGGGPAGSFEGTKDARMSPLNLTAEEKAALVAFLRTLTGEPIAPNLTRDPR